MLVALLLAVSGQAYAVDAEAPAVQASAKTTADYLSDLTAESAPDRLYAARVLKGQLVRALSVEARAKPGSLASDEARSTLVELEERLPEACTVGLAFPNVVAPCADMLVLLEVEAAVPAMKEKLAAEKRKGVRRRLEAAIASLGG